MVHTSRYNIYGAATTYALTTTPGENFPLHYLSLKAAQFMLMFITLRILLGNIPPVSFLVTLHFALFLGKSRLNVDRKVIFRDEYKPADSTVDILISKRTPSPHQHKACLLCNLLPVFNFGYN